MRRLINRISGQAWFHGAGRIATGLALTLSAGTFAEAPFVRNGEAGFVVSHIEFALAEDFAINGACPNGSPKSLVEIHQLTPEGQRLTGESDADYLNRMRQAAHQLGTSPDGLDLCMHPEVAGPDPHYRTVERSDIPVYGIDLDGEAAADDFPGLDGGQGVDNQWYRVVGCNRSYQSTGPSNTYNIGMLTGSWGLLFKLEGIDDIRNDEEVAVHLYANADPIRLSPSRDPLSYATYSPKTEPQYRASTTGRIVDGVLTTEPVDVSFQNETNSMYTERPLRDARLRVTIGADGMLQGYLAGYTPVQAMYDLSFGFRSGVKAGGELAPLRLRSGTANGAAFVLGHTCHGAYQALLANADGHPDPETGVNTSISTQYRIEAVPAFVVERQAVASEEATAP